MNRENRERRSAALLELATEIARDHGNYPCEREMAWAAQQTNEIALRRNTFRGLAGMTEAHVAVALADYLADRRMWNVRIYQDELAAGLRRCVLMPSVVPSVPGNVVLHRNSPRMVETWRTAGKVLEEYRVEDCPAAHEHR